MQQNLHRIPRIFVTEPLSEGAAVPLERGQCHYVGSVMRLKAGAQLRLFNGADGEWLSRIVSLGKRGGSVVAERRTRQQARGPDIHYLFAPLKHARLDYMVQKATELGASCLQPVLTHHTNVGRIKLERVHANAVEAAEQCNMLSVPEVQEAIQFSRLLKSWDPARRLIFCDEASDVRSPLEALSALPQGPAAVLIGPEGGFSNAERDQLLVQPFVTAISLGPRVMRADTAATAALSLVQAVMGDWR